ncbi:MAG TPA: GNAT family N-acetyltransferase [Chryseosolibacter sp.]
MAIEIRLLQESEDELANNFFNAIYKTNRPIENFKWEFRNGPRGSAIYVVAVDTAQTNFTKIVGIQCAIPLDLIRPDGTTVLTAKSEDTLVDPAYRGQKLFEKMYDLLFRECEKSGIKYIWGFTPALKAFERIGFQAPFKTSQAVLVFKPLEAYRYLKTLNPSNTLTDKAKILGLCALSYAKGLKRLGISKAKFSIREAVLNSKDDLLRQFYQKQPHYHFLRQNHDYLHWRLAKNPFGNHYRTFQAVDDSMVVADIIVNKRTDVSYIEQALFSPSLVQEERVQILKTIIDFAAEGTAVLRALCFETNDAMREQIAVLGKLGFTYLQRGNHFVWKPLDPTISVKPEDLFLSRLFTQGNI